MAKQGGQETKTGGRLCQSFFVLARLHLLRGGDPERVLIASSHSCSTLIGCVADSALRMIDHLPRRYLRKERH